jgi:hypothetical protein
MVRFPHYAEYVTCTIDIQKMMLLPLDVAFFSNPFPVSSVDVALDASIMDLSIEGKVTLTR